MIELLINKIDEKTEFEDELFISIVTLEDVKEKAQAI